MESLHLALSIEWDDCTVALGGPGLECLTLSARALNGGANGAQASRDALSLVQQALQQAGQPLSAVSCFHVNRGPGAFTSLRIAVGLIQGLALPGQRPVSAIDSLAALATTVPSWRPAAADPAASMAGAATVQAATAAPSPDITTDWLLCAAIDARMGECYYAVYRCRAGHWPETLLPPHVGSPEEARSAFGACVSAAAPEAGKHTLPLQLAGGAFRDFPALRDWATTRGQDPDEAGDRRPDAAAILRAATAVGAPASGPAREVQPLYVRDRVALDRDEQRQAALAREARRPPGRRQAGASHGHGHT